MPLVSRTQGAGVRGSGGTPRGAGAGRGGVGGIVKKKAGIDSFCFSDQGETCPAKEPNRPISVYRLGQMPIQTCGQSVSSPRGQAGARLNANTELRAKRQRSAREAIYRNRPIGAEL